MTPEDFDRRISLLEAAVARLMREGNNAAPRPASGASASANPVLPKYAQQWLDSWDERGYPRARVAAVHECHAQGGGGKGDWSGDPLVKKDPKKWGEKDGEPSMIGKHYSQCPAAYLKQVASLEEWKAMKTMQDPDTTQQKWVQYNLRAASLARGWAAIVSDPSHTPYASDAAEPEGLGPSDDGFPF